ncbi:CPBP family intramembrane glutamic endopeptidase [Paenibacillus sp. KS-LC4]|uniref:CPBP family intramembrane glutamic endopeptidase n=1 Tax=Paenibacillus sp. KS-LC4 TaxID=2979727 RepID=UPI0030CE4A8D
MTETKANTNPLNKPAFSEKRPVLAILIIQLLLLFAVSAAGAYATIKELNYTAPVLLSFIPIALALILYLTLRRKWGFAGFRPLSAIPHGGWKYYLPLVAVLIVIGTNGLKTLTPGEIYFFVFFTLLVGFVEETVYRGLILNILLRKSATTAVIVSSLLFGITHILNALSGQNAVDTTIQIVYSLMVGLSLALLMVKNRNIVPLILFHFVHNLIQFLGNERTAIGPDLLIIVILAAHCVWVGMSLRKAKRLP